MNASHSAVVILSIFVTISRANGRCSSYPVIMSCKTSCVTHLPRLCSTTIMRNAKRTAFSSRVRALNVQCGTGMAVSTMPKSEKSGQS